MDNTSHPTDTSGAADASSPRRKWYGLGAIAASLCLVATACGGPKPAPAPAKTTEAAAGSPAPEGASPESTSEADHPEAAEESEHLGYVPGPDGKPSAPGQKSEEPEAPETQDPRFPVKENAKVKGSKTFSKMASSGKIRIGVKADQPGLSMLKAETGRVSGFEIDLAKWVAASLGFPSSEIEFKEVASSTREEALSSGDVDLVIGTYSINADREAQVSFAGPYISAGQGFLVAKKSGIKSAKGLSSKSVCSVMGSTSMTEVKTKHPEMKATERNTYPECLDAVKAGKVDAVSTDQAMLLGYAAAAPEDFKVVKDTFGEKFSYGVGLPKGDTALCGAVNATLKKGGSTWSAIYKDNLGASGVTLKQPTPARCK